MTETQVELGPQSPWHAKLLERNNVTLHANSKVWMGERKIHATKILFRLPRRR